MPLIRADTDFIRSTDPVAFMKSVDRIKSLECKRIFPAHHRLDIPASLVGEVAGGFHEIFERGELVRGKGMFRFGDFSIHR